MVKNINKKGDRKVMENSEKLNLGQKIEIMRMAISGSTFDVEKVCFEERYKKAVDLICNYEPKEKE